MTVLSRRHFLATAGASAATAALPAGTIPAAVPTPVPRPLPTLADLKVWSERALAILQKHFPESIFGEVFLAEEGNGHHGLLIRCDCPDTSKKHGCWRCSTALDGTPMIGAMSGYYEPEWDEMTAYGLLADVLRWSGRPDGISDADWADALDIVGMTPDSHAARLVEIDREIAEMAADHGPLFAEPAGGLA